ncbi:multidrug efflux SMR transporter [Zafaria sp. Z1313]|uniref:DMT family transporter n=1 Tax=unclassified Zafaria TaxID=2828765 RepID=UPI002E76EBB4|nr:multidrug efflux SMR transporter [Zafaria sp. J156]MEE1621476.1 multidrug efflux SMR transporter [Zafaria sp. J156]
MAWLILVASGLLEAVWAVSLGKSEGFTKPAPTILFGVALVLSMGGLAYAMREISTGTAYAVWVGIGASLTVAYGMAFGAESVSWLKILLITVLIGCVVGLKFVE